MLIVDGRQIESPIARENDATCRDLGATTTLRAGALDFTLHHLLLVVKASERQQFEFFGGKLETKVAVGRCVFAHIQCVSC